MVFKSKFKKLSEIFVSQVSHCILYHQSSCFPVSCLFISQFRTKLFSATIQLWRLVWCNQPTVLNTETTKYCLWRQVWIASKHAPWTKFLLGGLLRRMKEKDMHLKLLFLLCATSICLSLVQSRPFGKYKVFNRISENFRFKITLQKITNKPFGGGKKLKILPLLLSVLYTFSLQFVSWYFSVKKSH